MAITSRASVAVNAIEVVNLVSHYGQRKILDDLSLTIQQGEIVSIMGGSGAGKSTLLRHLLGLHKPTSGHVSLLGIDITQASALQMHHLRSKIGVAFQGGALFSSMSVVDNVQLPLKEHTHLDTATMAIMARMKLEVVKLGGCEHLKPAELSGGMLKRAALARAIIMDPQLLFFDEPSAGLDPVVSAELDELILELREAMKMTIVVITHELQSAFKISDRIVILDHGKIIMTGSVQEVRNSDNRHVQDLLNRRAGTEELDADAYLKRLTGESTDQL